MASIFISYRREDTRADAGRLYDHLSAHFGADRVFMDIDDIAPGANFVDVLDRTLESADVLLVLIGPRWLDTDAQGRRRIDDEQDFVHIEVQRGLVRGAEVVPVLVGNTSMPAAPQLPQPLSGLSQRQAIEISDTRFRDDVERLIGAIEAMVPAREPPARGRSRLWLGVAGALVALALAAALLWWRAQAPTPLRNEPAVLSVAQAQAMLVRNDFYDRRNNAAGVGLRHRYQQRVEGDDVIVVDHSTGLVWEKGGSGVWSAVVIDEAPDRLAQLNAAQYGGFSDWRLPTLEEAMSLVTPQPVDGYHIDSVFDAREAPQMFTADRTESGAVWVVYLHEGMSLPESPRYNAWIRAVRGPD